MLDNIALLPQLHKLQVIVLKLKAVKIELPQSFQVGEIIMKLPPTWKGYGRKCFITPKIFCGTFSKTYLH